jgi:hypothetical protein
MWALVLLQIALEESRGIVDLVLSIFFILLIFGSVAVLGRLFDRLMAY